MEMKALLVHIKLKCLCGYICAMNSGIFSCLPFSANTHPSHTDVDLDLVVAVMKWH